MNTLQQIEYALVAMVGRVVEGGDKKAEVAIELGVLEHSDTEYELVLELRPVKKARKKKK